MAFPKNRPKSVMVLLWNLAKIAPEIFRPNRCLIDLFIRKEYPLAESVICSLQNLRKMTFRKNRLKITKMPSGKIRPNSRPNRPLLEFIVGGEYPKPDSVIYRLQNPTKMAFPKNRPKSVMVPLWNLAKIAPEIFRPNRC
ncbi:unnamed protein product [Linum trigynum]|uniref:Uncharacterized protein n=1 Tax=Linum trigynum TaxID=586398 RepID=A0AAV2G0K3_9ROSI